MLVRFLHLEKDQERWVDDFAVIIEYGVIMDGFDGDGELLDDETVFEFITAQRKIATMDGVLTLAGNAKEWVKAAAKQKFGNSIVLIDEK